MALSYQSMGASSPMRAFSTPSPLMRTRPMPASRKRLSGGWQLSCQVAGAQAKDHMTTSAGDAPLIMLNGTSSAGKTTLAKAIQRLARILWLRTGLDSCFAMVPEKWGAKYRRLLPCIRGSRRECASVALAATHCGKNAPTASGDDGFAAHLSRLASLSPGLRSRRPFTSRWVCREVGVSLASQSDAV